MKKPYRIYEQVGARFITPKHYQYKYKEIVNGYDTWDEALAVIKEIWANDKGQYCILLFADGEKYHINQVGLCLSKRDLINGTIVAVNMPQLDSEGKLI